MGYAAITRRGTRSGASYVPPTVPQAPPLSRDRARVRCEAEAGDGLGGLDPGERLMVA